MKYLDEYRDPEAARRLAASIRETATRRWSVMEVCGGQTHTLLRCGIDTMIAPAVELIHGPGCPVCVTPIEKIDRAIAIAGRAGTTLATFGDMMRVPGSRGDLFGAKARGADVRIVYSPLDAVRLAEANPDREVVFFAVGFETTAPANALAAWIAARRDLPNFSLLVSQVRIPPAIEAVLGDAACRVRGFIAPGHVCTVMGLWEYERLADVHRVPFVVTGFEPLDLLEGILLLVRQLEAGRKGVENQYARSVRPEGNPRARELVEKVFRVADVPWRGLGPIPRSGLVLRPGYERFDAEGRFAVASVAAQESAICVAGAVLQGKRKPLECPAFGSACTPDRPLGAPMVSAEGACAAYYAFRRAEEAVHA